MRALVAGGAGFIGSHLCARLLADGHEVVCIDNLLTGSEHTIAALRPDRRFHFLRYDVCALDDIRGACDLWGGHAQDLGCDAIFHLASPASPLGYWTYPFETLRANTLGTTALLDLAQRHNARFLFASSSEVYGDSREHPQREDSWGNVNPIGVRACYDESKRLGETFTMEYQRHRGVDARIVRIFNTYGPQMRPDDGRMVPAFVAAALRGEPLVVYGDGLQSRSLCYVDDLVDGLVRAMLTPGTSGQVYNLGSPTERTVSEWAALVVRLCGSASAITFAPAREDDPTRRHPDICKAGQQLGWSPQVEASTGVPRTIDWFRAELEQQAACQPLHAH